MDTPAAEIDIDEALVRVLLRDQHPDLAERTLTLVGNGWDNAMVRLGDDLVVRLPRRQVAAALIEKEQRWLPQIAEQLTVVIPTPIRHGVPSKDFRWPWSISGWLDGERAVFDPGGDLVPDLAQFLRELHVAAPPDAPVNAVRGVPLADRHESVRRRLETQPIPRRSEIAALWSRCVDTPPWSGPPLWLHGDLHLGNILTRAGRLAAIIDFGDLTAGDPATDLAVAWLLFNRRSRDRLHAELSYDEATWQRAIGWAIIFATLALDGDSTFRRFGQDALREVLLD